MGFCCNSQNSEHTRMPIKPKVDLKTLALEYHAQPTPGKFQIKPIKKMDTAVDLSLAYSPGVA